MATEARRGARRGGVAISLLAFTGDFNHDKNGMVELPDKENVVSSDVSYTTISITSDVELLAEADYGNGSIDNPCVIENRTIIGDSSSSCIYIDGVSLFFSVKNCSLSNGTNNTNNTIFNQSN